MDPTEKLTTRTVIQRDYAIIDPAGFCPTRVPGFEGCTVNIMASPGLGADFVHYLVHIPPGERAVLSPGPGAQTFAYVLDGEASARANANSWGLVRGGYVYAAPGDNLEIRNIVEGDLNLVVFRHRHRFGPGEAPWMIAGDIDGVDPDPREPGSFEQRRLLPDEPAFDLMINVLDFDPGDSHPFVENHHETHGLYMLEGGGRYFLGDGWYEVRAGDYVWMGHFVPQAFVCGDGGRTRYLYSKEANRDAELL